MSTLASLAAMMKQLEDQLAQCMRCGLCQSVCPLYAQTGREADVARGKLALLDGLAQQILEDPKEAKERVERCLLCGSCAANCPSGVSALEIFLKARAILSGYLGLSPVKRAVFRGMLARPALFDRLMAIAPKFQGIFSKPADDMLTTSCARIEWPLGRRHFRRLAREPFHANARLLQRPDTGAGITVAFFTGCIIDKLYPQIGRATAQVLDHHGVGLQIPANQACCGIPALSAGDTLAFEKMLRHNLQVFNLDRFDYLITSCATCTSTISKLWPAMAAGLPKQLRDNVSALAEQTRDISQFLVEQGLAYDTVAGGGDAGHGVKVTYHDPCHLRKSLGIWQQPRQLLKHASSVDLVEMAEPEWCCGMGGSFNLLYYELSSAIGQRKLDNIRQSGAAVVATSCPACMTQISDGLSRSGGGVAVKHAIELYAQGLADTYKLPS